MRTMKGYCKRRARREVYKAVDAFYKGKNTYTKSNEEITTGDVYVGLGIILGFIILLSAIAQ
jgi:hypothetical protein